MTYGTGDEPHVDLKDAFPPKILVDHQEWNELNLALGLAIGQLVKAHIVPDEFIVAYLKKRGIIT
jgi:hypothetical protein